MADVKELKGETLKRLSGGAPNDCWHCDDWAEDPNHPIMKFCDDYRPCDFCCQMIRPEGPCKLNHPWFSI